MELSKFVFLEHTSDIKFRVFGKSTDELFENSVLAFSNYLCGEKKINSKKGKVIEVNGTDTKSLFYNFFDELIYLVDVEHFIPARAEVLLRGNNLKAELYGDDSFNYEIKQIKAATYAEMEIKKKDSGWEAQFVLDV